MEDFKKLVYSWGVSGLVLGFAAHSLYVGRVAEAILLVFLSFQLALLLKFCRRLDPSINNLFDWLIRKIENRVLKFWWLATSDFKRKYYQQLDYDCRDYRTQGLKTRGSSVLNLEKLFVPLEIAPESLRNISSSMLQNKGSKKELRIWDFLTKGDGQTLYHRLAIIGPPGSGKSTLLEHTALTYAHNQQRNYQSKALSLVPILIYLRDIRETVSRTEAPDLPTIIESRLEIKKLNPDGWFEDQLRKGRCLVMLDGLDEVADKKQRVQVSQWVKRQINFFPKSFFIVTSRPAGYRNMPLDELTTTLEVKPFSLSQIKEFIRSWYLQDEISRRLGKEDEGVRQKANSKSKDLIDRIVSKPSLSKLAVNPLLLTMIATVHCYRGALPGRRVELYDEICDVLLGRRQDAKGITDQLSAAQKKIILRCLSLKLMRRKTREFSLAVGASLISRELKGISNKVSAVNFLKNIETKSGLLVEREQNVYEFAHKSFQEYLASVEIESQQQVSLLVERLDDEWWAETIRLYAAQSDATPLIQAAINSDSVKILTLAFECLEEKLSVDPTVQNQLEQKLLLGLESLDEEIFRLAAETSLTRRLNKMLRLNEKISINTGYITCAEYQLFVNNQLVRNKHYEPDHWTSCRFPPGMANQPITGIRASAAVAFAKWLRKRTGVTYRLPCKSEIQKNYEKRPHNRGVWVLTSNSLELDLSNVSEELSQHWQSIISSTLESTLKKDVYRAVSCLPQDKIISDYRRAIGYTLSLVRMHKIDVSRAYNLDLINHLGHALNQNIDLNHYLKAASILVNLDSNLTRIRKLVDSREQERNQERAFIHELQDKKKNTTKLITGLKKKIRKLRADISSIEESYEKSVDLSSVYNPTLSAHRNDLDSLIREQKSAYSHVDKIDSDIEKVLIDGNKRDREHDNSINSQDLNFVYDLEIARSIGLSLSLNREVKHDLEMAVSRFSGVEKASKHLCLYLAFWGILCKFYAQDMSSMKMLSDKRKQQIYQSGKKECYRNFHRVLDTYSFFLITSLRRAEVLPAWESLQLAREDET